MRQHECIHNESPGSFIPDRYKNNIRQHRKTYIFGDDRAVRALHRQRHIHTKPTARPASDRPTARPPDRPTNVHEPNVATKFSFVKLPRTLLQQYDAPRRRREIDVFPSTLLIMDVATVVMRVSVAEGAPAPALPLSRSPAATAVSARWPSALVTSSATVVVCSATSAVSIMLKYVAQQARQLDNASPSGKKTAISNNRICSGLAKIEHTRYRWAIFLAQRTTLPVRNCCISDRPNNPPSLNASDHDNAQFSATCIVAHQNGAPHPTSPHPSTAMELLVYR